MSKLPGITRQDEEERLRETIAIAKQKVDANRQNVKALEVELHAMQEEFDESDKESQTMWHDTDARFKFVNQELRRAEQARKKPYFGRIDFTDKKIKKKEVYYIGRSVIARNPAEPEVIDWRAPIASVYYDNALGDVSYSVKGEGKNEIKLTRKRTYEIENDTLKDFYDSDVVANDELLTKYLAKNKRAVLGEIIATIQQEQNEVIRKKPQHNLIIQGAAGSGKTTVAMHRISYILYNYELEFAPEDFYIIGSNQVLLNYITGVLPELNVYGVSQMTMEQLFIRLLYEEWDPKKYSVKKTIQGVTPPVKGTMQWFTDLADFCTRYEKSVIPMGDVRIEKNKVLLLSGKQIERIFKESLQLSRADKITRLTEHLMAKLENEISGKYYSYSQSEKKRLTDFYETYFGKREWKGSIFEMYDSFLSEQAGKGLEVALPGESFDLYDLSALAYLYKRLKEDEVIREAGHVVIDEAQDFGMMTYACLKYCLSKCTYTIMGDVSQNISIAYGLNDWSELIRLMLPGEFDYFGLLRKSYRNTVEISNFATDILYHGSFDVYPIEPIIRHGKEVAVKKTTDYQNALSETTGVIKAWMAGGMETVAIICADETEAVKVSRDLAGQLPLVSVTNNTSEFTEGVMVLSLEYTKGLEFDAVLLFDASEKNYPVEDGYAKRLYVACTRALHELVVFYTGKLTGLIADPVSEENRKQAVVCAKAPARPPMPKEEEITKEERYKRIAMEGERERSEREKYGPKKIELTREQKTAPKTSKSKTKEFSLDIGERQENLKLPTYLERRKQELAGTIVTQSYGEFGEMPQQNMLQPQGHAKIDTTVRFSMKGDGYYDIYSNYGTLRLTPLSTNVIRVSFAKGQVKSFPETLAKYKKQPGRYTARDGMTCIDVNTGKITARVDKKSGAITFLDEKGKILLCEKKMTTRQIGQGMVWEYLDFARDEKLFAKTPGDNKPLPIGNSAKYISYGEGCRLLPGLASSKGYELAFPTGVKILVVNIPMYGPYIAFENVDCIDFYFISSEKTPTSTGGEHE